MPIDPRIALGVQPLQLPQQNPNAQMNMLAQAMQLKSGMSQMQAAEQERAERNALNEAYRGALGADGSVDRNALFRTLADRNLGAKIPGLQKQFADADKATADVGKTKADTEKANLEVAHKRVDSWGQAMGFVRQNPTPENAAAAVQHLVRLGVMPPEMAQAALAQVQQNPQGVAQWADMGFRAALSAKDQLPKFETRNTGGSTDTLRIDPVSGQAGVAASVQNTQSPDNAASNARMAADAAAARAVQIRGQNLSDARARDQVNASKAPAGYRWAADGKSLEPIPGGPVANKTDNASEGERKASTLLQRLEGSQAQLAAALKEDPGAAKPQLISSGLRSLGMEALANTNDNPTRQRVEAAQLDMLDAALTLGTGAAYTREQLEGYRKSYFPQIGDDAATVKDKQDRLNNVITAARTAAGRAAPKRGAQSAPEPVNSDIDALLKKYGGK